MTYSRVVVVNSLASVAAVVAAACWSAPIAWAFIPEGSIDRVGATFKDGDTVTSPAALRQRQLQDGKGDGNDLLTTRYFTDCLDQNLSPEKCQDYIQNQISEAGGHEVGDVNVKIQVPRSKQSLKDTYWMVEVPMNIRGQKACDRNQGHTYYPFMWNNGSSSSGEGIPVEDLDCRGLSAGECCLMIHEYGKALTPSGYDVHGQCLACFVHQEPLVPIVNDQSNGATDYLDYTYSSEDDTCEQEQLTGDDLDILDSETAAKVDLAIASLTQFKEDPACDTFSQLLVQLYDAAVQMHPLSHEIGMFACSGICYDGRKDTELETFELQIDTMLNLLKVERPSSKENRVIIYTNAEGDIVDTPKLGGSRASDPYENDRDPRNAPPVAQNDQPGIITCNDAPELCGENQYCSRGSDGADAYYQGDQEQDEIFECKDYAGVGDECYGLMDYRICNPEVAFCVELLPCWSDILENRGTCVEYGVNTCTEATKDSACASDEWCDLTESRCKPNVDKDRCCDPDLNNCGFGSEAGTLTCVECVPAWIQMGEDTFPAPHVDSAWTCQPTCSDDDDCYDGEQCTTTALSGVHDTSTGTGSEPDSRRFCMVMSKPPQSG